MGAPAYLALEPFNGVAGAYALPVLVRGSRVRQRLSAVSLTILMASLSLMSSNSSAISRVFVLEIPRDP